MELNETRINRTNIFYACIQQLPDKFYNVNQQGTGTSKDLDDAGKIESEQAVMAYLEVDDDSVRSCQTSWHSSVSHSQHCVAKYY
jgi:hypothetical protein